MSTATIVDLATLLFMLILGGLGFWRGIVKESMISGALLFGVVLAATWDERWGTWLATNSTLEPSGAVFVIRAACILASASVFGYIGCHLADIPPADMPGRIGGFIVGLLNAVLLIAILVPAAWLLVLTDRQRTWIDQSHGLDWMQRNPDWLILIVGGIGLLIVAAAILVRRRRAAYLPAIAERPGSSGYQPRRAEQPLAPEAVKIDPTPGAGIYSSWNVAPSAAATVPLTRVADPTDGTDRNGAQSAIPSPSAESIRCISCGERISAEDRFCPRCGRLLVH